VLQRTWHEIRMLAHLSLFYGCWEQERCLALGSLTMQPLVTCILAGKYIFQASYFSSPRFISLSFSIVVRIHFMKCVCEKWVSVVSELQHVNTTKITSYSVKYTRDLR